MLDLAPDDVIATETELRARFARPSRLATLKQLDRLDHNCRRFIELSPLVCLATSRPGGLADNSPRGDAPGFVKVLDERTLLIPDRPGNNRLDSMANIVHNPNVGLLFLIPGVNETLRVNGRATIVSDAPFFDDLTVQGKRPRLALLIEVEEVYFHCAKAFLRSSLWKPETWPDRKSLPTMGQIFKDQMKLKVSAKAIDEDLALDAKTNQY